MTNEEIQRRLNDLESKRIEMREIHSKKNQEADSVIQMIRSSVSSLNSSHTQQLTKLAS